MNGDLVKKYFYYFFVGLILLGGFFLRLKLLTDNSSFWFDESALGFNILNLGFKDLFGILHLQQIAPPFFLVTSKVFVNIFGASDLVLRLFPFIIGNLAMILFFLILKQNFNHKLTILFGLFLFCFNIRTIYFSLELKPYIVELFSTCLILYLFPKINLQWSYKKLILFGIFFAIMPWFAFVSIGMLFVAYFLKFSKKIFKKWLVLFLPFLFSLSFFIPYYLRVKHFYNDFMVEFFKYSFLNIKELVFQLPIVFDFLYISWALTLSFILFVFGLIYCAVSKKYSFLFKFSLIFFICYVFVSFLKIYPLYDRFLLFILPIILLIILTLFEKFCELKNNFAKILLISIFFATLNTNFLVIYKSLKKPFNKNKTCARELFVDMAQKQKLSDDIIVDALSMPDFLYYNSYYHLKNRLYLNIIQKDNVIMYNMDRGKGLPFVENSSWLYFSWPSVDYSDLKYDYAKFCAESTKKGIIYRKGK